MPSWSFTIAGRAWKLSFQNRLVVRKKKRIPIEAPKRRGEGKETVYAYGHTSSSVLLQDEDADGDMQTEEEQTKPQTKKMTGKTKATPRQTKKSRKNVEPKKTAPKAKDELETGNDAEDIVEDFRFSDSDEWGEQLIDCPWIPKPALEVSSLESDRIPEVLNKKAKQ